jgi:hypothetical protein
MAAKLFDRVNACVASSRARRILSFMIERRLDEESGIIHVVGTGIWKRADIDAHYAWIREVAARLRAGGQPLRLLSDVTGGQRQAPEIEAYVKVQMARTFAPGDRVALLVADLQTQRYARTLLGDAEMATFCSRDAAMAWLRNDKRRTS